MDLPFLAGLSNLDMLIVLGAGVVFLVMAYMIFKQLMKAFVIGLISAAIPVVLYLFGFDIGLSVQTVVWFGLAGVATYFVYDVINGWMTIIKIVTWPIRHAFGRGKPSVPKQKGIKPAAGENKPRDFSPQAGKEEENEEIES